VTNKKNNKKICVLGQIWVKFLFLTDPITVVMLINLIACFRYSTYMVAFGEEGEGQL